jgi:hypothetical protein
VSDVFGRCWEVALGDGRSSHSHLGRRRDTGQPGETIEISMKTGEQSYLALPTGESNEPIIEMQLPLGGMHQREDLLIALLAEMLAIREYKTRFYTPVSSRQEIVS